MDKYIEELRKKAPAQALAMEAREILEAAYGEIAEKVKELADEREIPEDVSEEVAASIDREARKMMDSAYERCTEILTEHMDQLHVIASVLYEKETVEAFLYYGIDEISVVKNNA